MPDLAKPQADSHSFSVIQESLEIGKQQVETGALRVRKVAHETAQSVDMQLQSRSASVDRVSVNRPVEQVFAPYQEGETLVVPVFEEVVIKQLFLKEEVRITVHNQSHELHDNITLRNEEAIVERYDAEAGEWKAEAS
jgi:uncharacterized protein (TIGR02271 family)